METNSFAPAETAPTQTATSQSISTAGAGPCRAARIVTTALCAMAFAVLIAFGGPDESSSRWDNGVDAHSDAGYELAVDTNALKGE